MPNASVLRLHSTLSKREEEFVTIEPKKVRMYTCGPTVYGRPHIGNYASFLMGDLLRRWLEVKGYAVEQVKNITDVGHLVADADAGEDKIQKQAEKERLDPLAIARRYTEQYLADEARLKMEEPFARPRASEYIKEMLAMVKGLLEKGNAYETPDGVYFDVTTFPQYGALSGNTLENLSAGARVAVDEGKRHPADFAIWKKCVGENARHILRWSFATGEKVSTTGEDAAVGFPGWHIECSAMSKALLGQQIDIHTGGEDNIFPHHECEIAQSEAVSGKHPFSRFWIHRRRIDLGDQKMSKSLGNVLDLPAIEEMGFSPDDLRYYLLSVHYRTNLKFTTKGLDDARKARRKIVEWMQEVENEWMSDDAVGDDHRVDALTVIGWEQKFEGAMDSDLNTPAALGVLFDVLSFSRHEKVHFIRSGITELKTFIGIMKKTFGCFDPEEDTAIPAEILALARRRDEARARKDFAESDRLRDAIVAQGYEIRDSSDGTKVKRR